MKIKLGPPSPLPELHDEQFEYPETVSSSETTEQSKAPAPKQAQTALRPLVHAVADYGSGMLVYDFAPSYQSFIR